jgi:hypothetical protein
VRRFIGAGPPARHVLHGRFPALSLRALRPLFDSLMAAPIAFVFVTAIFELVIAFFECDDGILLLVLLLLLLL